MNRNTALVIVVALLAALIIGWMYLQKDAGPKPAQTGTPLAPQTMAPAADGQKIGELQALLAADPGNRRAWVELGHLYFDSDQPAKAIDAYQRALDLDARDADVLTDQGVMFRRVGKFDKAIDNFTRANRVDPRHATSLYNLGIVYRYDLMNFAKAEEAWNGFLAINPTGPGADQVRQQMNALKMLPK